jgi:tRNA-2-methylthio-N6-dimethylallyladenosine synthase
MDIKDKTFFIRTFGCQMNENDSEKIAGVLAAAGARPAERAEEADIVVVNTCAVREKSEEKLFSYLGRLRPRRGGGKAILLGVAGCVAQAESEVLLRRFPDLDFVVGPDNYLRLPEIIARHTTGPIVADEWSAEWTEAPAGLYRRESPVTAFVTIMEGCNNFCSYCIVPFSRGREKFRPLRSILAELDELAGRGYREIQFLGQNVNSYRDPETGTPFAELLTAAGRVSGLKWVRFITSHPKNFSPAIIEAMAATPVVCRQLHLPLQSGSSPVLARMNRGYAREEYLERIARLRDRMPDISLSTDIIVGFPGETEDEFQETLSALETVRFANIFSFRYSPRPRTAAARGGDDIPFEVKKNRLIEVQALQKRIQTDIHQSLIGKTMEILAVGPSKKDPAEYSGRNEGYQVVNFRSETDVTGRFVRIEITGAGPYSLRGRLIED